MWESERLNARAWFSAYARHDTGAGGTRHVMHRCILILVKGYHALCSSKSATSKEFSTGSAGYGMDMEPEYIRGFDKKVGNPPKCSIKGAAHAVTRQNSHKSMLVCMKTAVKISAKPSIQHCQEGQHYKLESGDCECRHSCSFSWNINGIHQKRPAARNVTLYSPPFYNAGQNGGYKMCLFLYLDGDGSGKGTHLSFYIAVMRGEHDGQLTWPFKQKVTLTLEDQDQQQHITQWFKL